MRLSGILDVRRDERRRVTGMFSLLAVIISTSYILKPVRSALFLSEFGSANLPYVYLLVAIVLGIVAAAFARLSPRANLARLLSGASYLFASNLILFWLAVVLEWPFTGFAFYVWVSIFTALMPSLFWLLANYVFFPNEGRRLFPVVMAGGLLGSIAGGGLTSLLVPVVGTPGLLLSAAALLAGVGILVRWNVSRERERMSERRSDLARRERNRSGTEDESPLTLLRRSRYLTMMAGLIVLTSLVSTLVDYQFSVVVEQSFATRDAMTRFFGMFFAGINVLAFVLQLVGVGRLLGRFGVAGGLVMLPSALCLASVSFLAVPTLVTASLIKAADDGFSNSVNRASVEVLYLPVPLVLKNRLKAWLDMFVERVSRGVAGLTILAATSVFSMTMSQMSVLVLCLIVPWMVLIVLLKREYVSTFRSSIARRDIGNFSASLTDPSSLSVIHQILAGDDPREIHYVLALVAGTHDGAVLGQVRGLTTHPSASVRAAAYRVLRSTDPAPEFSDLPRRIRDEEPAVAAEALALHLRADPAAGRVALDRVVASGDVVRMQAVLDCLEGSAEGLSAEVLETIIRNHRDASEPGSRRLAAVAMAFLPDASQSKLDGWVALLRDPDLDVARAAAKSAGVARTEAAFPVLVEQLRRPPIRRATREALASYGPGIIGELAGALRDDSRPHDLRLAIPQVLAELDDQRAVDALVAFLPADDRRLHYQAIKGLGTLRSRNPSLRFARARVEELIALERDALIELARLATALGRVDAPRGESLELLRVVLEERIEFTRERLFRLLALVYPAEEIASAVSRITNGRPVVRGAALEYLANLFSRGHRAELLPLLEAAGLPELQERAHALTGIEAPSLERGLVVLAHSSDEWVAACAITAASELGAANVSLSFATFLEHDAEVVREAARRALHT